MFNLKVKAEIKLEPNTKDKLEPLAKVKQPKISPDSKVKISKSELFEDGHDSEVVSGKLKKEKFDKKQQNEQFLMPAPKVEAVKKPTKNSKLPPSPEKPNMKQSSLLSNPEERIEEDDFVENSSFVKTTYDKYLPLTAGRITLGFPTLNLDKMSEFERNEIMERGRKYMQPISREGRDFEDEYHDWYMKEERVAYLRYACFSTYNCYFLILKDV